MPHLQLDALREKLLRAGIAPRHVRRYLGELRQHFDDLLRAETANGLAGAAAFQAARARLGSDDNLAAAMLARPELRSISARFPWAVYGVGPALALPLLLIAAVLVEIGLGKISHTDGTPAPDWMKLFAAGWDWSMMYLLPLIVAALFFCLGARRLTAMAWLVVGALLVAALGAAITVSTIFSIVPHQSAFSVGFGFSSSATPPRMALNVALVCAMSALYWLWRRQKSAVAKCAGGA